jgi:hypothetical protein
MMRNRDLHHLPRRVETRHVRRCHSSAIASSRPGMFPRSGIDHVCSEEQGVRQ